VKEIMSSSNKSSKLEKDYQDYVKSVEEAAAADLEKIRSDLNALKIKATQYGSAS
jgi:predicted transcriptional regulator